MARAIWIQGAGPGDIINNVPESFLLGDRAVYIDAFLTAKGALSPDTVELIVLFSPRPIEVHTADVAANTATVTISTHGAR